MSSRDKILSVVKQNQPLQTDLPTIKNYDQHYENLALKFVEVLQFIGGEVYTVNNYSQIAKIVKDNFAGITRIVSTCPELETIATISPVTEDAHLYADVDLFITTANLAVAENGAVWLSEKQMHSRALPFIAQQLAVIIKKESIVATMHDAYDIIGNTDYGYAAFIAGPSKTADIAQSLVLGAHGPKMMTVFIIE